MGKDFETGADSTALGIVGAVDEVRDTGLEDGACAHAARLDGDVEGGIGEAVVAEKAGGFSQDDDFCVGGGVAIANRAVAGTGQNLAVVDDHGADGNFASCCRSARFEERFLHELDITFHAGRENNMRGEEERN